MPEIAISLQLVPATHCRAHWIVVLSQSHKTFSIGLVLDELRWTKGKPDEAFDTVTFRATDKCPEIEALKGRLWISEDLMLPTRQCCSCVQWV